MTTPSQVAIGVVAALHVYFLVVEMFLWTKPYGRRVFGLTPEFAQQSRALAANQEFCHRGDGVIDPSSRRLVPCS